MIGERAPIVEKPPPRFANHSAFIETIEAYARDVLARLGVAPSRIRLAFTGHPIPTATAAACD